MSNQQLTVKAFLKRSQQKRISEQPDEIRRFGIDYDVATSYDYLLAKINSVFPGLRSKLITLYWKDSDEDMIAFSSDEELVEAMKSVSDGLFRVFIVEKKMPRNESSGPTESQRDVLHRGVTCDGCNGEVRGIRHKCKVCPDYDLCNECKSAGKHSEHEMLIIERPRMPFLPFGMHFPGPIGGHPMPPPFMGGMPTAPPAYGCCPPPAFGFVPQGPAPQEFDSAEARKGGRKAWKRWCKEAYGCGLHEHKRKKGKKDDKKKKQKTSSSSSSSESEGCNSPSGEYLKNIGESVAAMLDPLGIDVDIDVEHHGQRRKCHRDGMGYPFGGRMRGGPWGMRGPGCSWRMRQPGCYPQQTPTPAAAAAANCNNEASTEQAMSDSPLNSTLGPSQNPAANSETGEMTIGPESEWTVVDDQGLRAEVEGATAGVRGLDMSDGASSNQKNSDSGIDEAVTKMMSMGFSNDGGWLSDLLTYHKGDIGRALDAIHAKK